MTVPSTETALQKEQRLFREFSTRLRDTLLSRLFDLRPEKAQRRSSYLAILFIISGFAVSLPYYPLSEWAGHIGNILTATLSTTSTPEQLRAAINGFLFFLRDVVLDARILQYLPVFLAPFFIALQSAAMYLVDVFELPDVGVARRFIGSVALSGSDETIQIKHGEIADESKESPVFQIGGPGKVVVELDSVALFERADGTPHIIGPTGKEPGGKATLEGFERFRQALDIRDHHVELRDQDDNKSKAVKSRSRDGIPVKATDVRLMFSIFRGNNPEPSKEYPYPFSRDAVEQIVYKAASGVTPEKPNPSTFEFSWINNMVGLIRSRLGNFMSQRNLTEYLASIGMPEIEKSEKREETILREMQELAQPDEAKPQGKKSPPDFQARYKVKDLFAEFAVDFTDKAHDNGVELHWIGVGTWESMVKVVPEKHTRAWLLSQENMKNDDPEEIKRLGQLEMVEKTTDLIQKVPLDAFEAIHTSAKDTKHDHNVQALLLEYRKLLQEAADVMNKDESVSQNILGAIKYIDNLIAHWAGS